MIWPYRDFWVYSVLYLTVGLQNVQDWCQMGATTFRLGAAIVMPRDISYQSETVLNWIIAIDETWTRAYEPELKKTVYHMPSFTFTKKTQGLIKCHPKKR